MIDGKLYHYKGGINSQNPADGNAWN